MKPVQTYIIAEAGVNHNGSLELAKKLVDAAVEAGVDAIKFQTFQTELLVSKNAPKADYQTKATDAHESQYEMLKKLELTKETFTRLFDYCARCEIQFLSTPFDIESLDFLINDLNIPLIKIPSGEITNAPLLLKAAQSSRDIILSTGMCTLGEIEAALMVIAYGYLGNTEVPSQVGIEKAYCSDAGQEMLRKKVTLLHCTTEYPAEFKDVNIRVMDTMREAFALPVGYSDHTVGIAVPIGAVARGATIIEKHFTLDKNLPGPDHAASLEPDQLKQMVEAIRQVENALGSNIKRPTVIEQKNKLVARKSLVAAKNINKGELFSEDNLQIKRPGTGISPMLFWRYFGKPAERDYLIDEVID